MRLASCTQCVTSSTKTASLRCRLHRSGVSFFPVFLHVTVLWLSRFRGGLRQLRCTKRVPHPRPHPFMYYQYFPEVMYTSDSVVLDT
jgi:hypothetical protein